MKLKNFLNKYRLKLIVIPFLSIFLLLIILNFSIHYFKTLSFNNTKHIFQENSETENIEFLTYPRGGSSDSWVKENVLIKSKNETLTATIYEGKIINKHEFSIKKWNVKINIQNDCFINNSWCGTVEIHQNSNGIEKVQTLDLRELKKEDLTLDYLILDQETLIPLSKGDYIIYNPKENAELEIDGNSAYALIGFIFYYTDDSFNLNDFEFQYFLKKGFFQGKSLSAFIISSALWILIFIVYLAFEISSIQTKKQLLQKDKLIEEALNVFSNFIDAKDNYTNGHSSRVAEYSMKIAEKLELSEKECKTIYNIALLHDCGKCYIPDSVLKKHGRLNDEEYQIIRKHTEYGAKILENFLSFPEVLYGALYHHERYDGKGYPTGKRGEEIPLIGRIICVADSFDAMNSSRCYREPLPMKKIISEIENGKGTQFDPKIADIFLELLKENKISKKKK